MRFFGKAAIAMALGFLAAMAPQMASAQDAGHRVAVVDVAYIFKNHPGIKDQVAAVENELKTYGGEMQKRQEELKAA
ncbi:MAG: OmpH family outer membrane protein, partial [Rubripirellula sp.]